MEVNYKWEAKHSKLFSDVISLLNASGIRYFILRNYEGLPETNFSKDVDIIIEPGSYKAAAECIYQAFKKNNVPRYYVVKYERVRCWFGMDVDNDFSIHLDIIEGYLSKGVEIFSFEDLYAHTIPYKNMKVLDDIMDASMLLLYKVIGCKDLKARYREKIARVYHGNKSAFLNILSRVFSTTIVSQLENSLDSDDYDDIIRIAGKMSSDSKKKAFYKHPINTSINVSKFWLGKLYRIGWCPKKFRKLIAVEAPDGTGKTTFLDALTIKLSEMFVSDSAKMHIYHFRPSLLPNLGAVGEKASRGVIKQDTNFTNPHRAKPANFFGSLIRMTYYWIDYIVGGFVFIRKDVQFDKFSIFDRYIYDFIVDPARSRIKLPDWLRTLYAKFVYKPDFVFVLQCDPKIVYKRKQELSLDEISRQMKGFNSLLSMGRNFVSIDASQVPEKMCKSAVKMIVEKYTKQVQ